MAALDHFIYKYGTHTLGLMFEKFTTHQTDKLEGEIREAIETLEAGLEKYISEVKSSGGTR